MEGGPVERIGERLLSWASEIDEVTLRQAERTSRLPVVADHIALMPDAHLGKGATIGSVIPTESSIIPSAVGVDIGCGMIAVETDLRAEGLPESLDRLVPRIERAVPAGLGHWHKEPSKEALRWIREHSNPRLTDAQVKRCLVQFGTLGSGNHFFEICLDEREVLWVVLHSGSRGVGNQLAMHHIAEAKGVMRKAGTLPEDPELAWLVQGTPQFEAYVGDMLWAQAYAMANRGAMMDAALTVVFDFLAGGARGHEVSRVNCHHNFAALEEHGGRKLWITRKGAIRAESGDLGVIPGAMGGKSYIVRGTGEPLSWRSCAHGAGRRMSRHAARRAFTPQDLEKEMAGRAWQRDKARQLLDEIPGSYKDIDRVMTDQKDLVEVVHQLRGIVNYKGTS